MGRAHMFAVMIWPQLIHVLDQISMLFTKEQYMFIHMPLLLLNCIRTGLKIKPILIAGKLSKSFRNDWYIDIHIQVYNL